MDKPTDSATAVNDSPITRCRGSKLAQDLAAERQLSWGVCIHDGWYYVGTPEQLKPLDVILEKY